jgi:hypothetical protein
MRDTDWEAWAGPDACNLLRSGSPLSVAMEAQQVETYETAELATHFDVACWRAGDKVFTGMSQLLKTGDEPVIGVGAGTWIAL